MSTPETVSAPAIVPRPFASRLTVETFLALKKELSINYACPKTELEAGFQLGIRHVLDKLQEKMVIGL